MGKSAKPFDHIVMATGVIKEVLETRAFMRRQAGHQPLEQVYAVPLQHRILRMFERHIGKDALHRRELLVVAAGNAVEREHLRGRIGGPRTCIVAVEVAAELIKHDQQRQPTLGRLRPVIEIAAPCGVQRVAKAGADGRIKGVVALIPMRLGIVGEPEIQHVRGGRHARSLGWATGQPWVVPARQCISLWMPCRRDNWTLSTRADSSDASAICCSKLFNNAHSWRAR